MEIAARDAAAVLDAVGQALGVWGFGPALVDDAVAEGVLAAFGPGADGGGGVVGVVVDVADFGVALRVRGREGGGQGGGGGAGEGGRVGVEDDLVVGADPAVVPEDDRGCLLPGGFGLAALVGAGGRDDVAA